MAQMANWNGHTFTVSPNLIRGFTDLSIKGGCETTDKNSEKQKYVERKYGEIPEIGMTVGLNALTGVTDVFSEAMAFVKEAMEGACAYFYLGTSKLLPAKMMLIQAEVVEVVNLPGKGDKWISCNVKLKFKQGSKNDGGGSSSNPGNNKPPAEKKKESVKTPGTGVTVGKNDALTVGKNKAKDYVKSMMNTLLNDPVVVAQTAKAASKDSKTTTTSMMIKSKEEVEQAIKQTKTTTNSATKVSPTTGRITPVGSLKGGGIQKSVTMIALNR